SSSGSLWIFDTAGSPPKRIPALAHPVGIAVDQSGRHALVLNEAGVVQVWDLGSKSVQGTINLPGLSAVGFNGASGEILTVAQSGIFGLWLPEGSRLSAYGNVSLIKGGWTALNPTGRGVVTFDGSRTIEFKQQPQPVNGDALQSVVRAAAWREMTAGERQL